MVGRHRELRRDLAERLDDQQLARVGLEVAGEGGEVAAGLGDAVDGQQRLAGVAGGDGVERAEQHVVVGDAEHREHVGAWRSPCPSR